MTDMSVRAVSDSELRQALLGTWRIVSCQANVDGKIIKPWGDNSPGYLVYTQDGHVFVQMADPERRDLLHWTPARGPLLREAAEADAALGAMNYWGTFDILDGQQVIHHVEWHSVVASIADDNLRSVTLNGDQLTLDTPVGAQLVWERVQ
jgi:hypothetical protein